MRLIKVGRDQSCDLRLNSPKVSSLHAEITILNNGDMLLEDKGSTNGTFIMNRPIKPGTQVPISRGDAVRFGDTELVWSMIPPMEDLSRYKGIYGIGKHSLNEIRLDGATVSRFHATLKKEKDDKVYIEDHSKNGTTVNGEKLAFGQRRRIKRGDAVVCGGVTVPESYLKSIIPNSVWPKIAAALGGVAAVVGIVFLILQIIDIDKDDITDDELYKMYNKSIVMVEGAYHYRVSAGNYDWALRKCGPTDNIVPYYGDVVFGSISYSGTGFWFAGEGMVVTNNHVAKPWAHNDEVEEIADYFKRKLSEKAKEDPSLIPAISAIKVEGVFDNIGVIPNGKYYDTENLIKCTVLATNENTNIDVALLQCKNQDVLPRDIKYVNKDSLVLADEDIEVGSHIYTMGFPAGRRYQTPTAEELKNLDKLKLNLYAQGGSINREPNEYVFGHNAASKGGASGSPMFNKRGYLVGVLNSGWGDSESYNYAVKAKHIKSMLDDYKKKQ